MFGLHIRFLSMLLENRKRYEQLKLLERLGAPSSGESGTSSWRMLARWPFRHATRFFGTLGFK